MKQSVSKYQHISFAFFRLNCIDMMSGHRRPAISSMRCLGGKPTSVRHRYTAEFGHTVSLGIKPTSARHRQIAVFGRPHDGPISKSCPPAVVGFITTFIMLESSASCHTSSSCFTNSSSQLVPTCVCTCFSLIYDFLITTVFSFLDANCE